MNRIERKWEDLGSDCLIRIFCYLGLEDLILAIPFVCKSWYEASLDHQCWKNLDFGEMGFYSGSNLERRFKQEYGSSVVGKSFSFSSFMKICVRRSHRSSVELTFPYIAGCTTMPDLIYASIECPRLKLLALGGIGYKDEEKLVDLISKWKELEILKIAGNPRSMSTILEQISLSCPNFIGLHLCELFSTLNSRAIVRWIPGLKIFAIRDSIIFKESLIELLEGCRDLEVLYISNCAGFDVDEEILMKASKINKFNCEGTSKKGALMHRIILQRLRVYSKFNRLS